LSQTDTQTDKPTLVKTYSLAFTGRNMLFQSSVKHMNIDHADVNCYGVAHAAGIADDAA